jgi:hypothetical protein
MTRMAKVSNKFPVVVGGETVSRITLKNLVPDSAAEGIFGAAIVLLSSIDNTARKH